MDRLNEALKLLGVNQSTPLQVLHTFVMNILPLAYFNGDEELEEACLAKAEEIRSLLKNSAEN